MPNRAKRLLKALGPVMAAADAVLESPGVSSIVDSRQLSALQTARQALHASCRRLLDREDADTAQEPLLHIRAVALAVVAAYHDHFRSFAPDLRRLPLTGLLENTKAVLLPSPVEVWAVGEFLRASAHAAAGTASGPARAGAGAGAGAGMDASGSDGAGGTGGNPSGSSSADATSAAGGNASANGAVTVALADAIRLSRLWDVARWHMDCAVYKPTRRVVRCGGFTGWPTANDVVYPARLWRLCLLSDCLLVRPVLSSGCCVPSEYRWPDGATAVPPIPAVIPLASASAAATPTGFTISTGHDGVVLHLLGVPSNTRLVQAWLADLQHCIEHAVAEVPRRSTATRAMLSVVRPAAAPLTPRAVVFCGSLVQLLRECVDPSPDAAAKCHELAAAVLYVVPHLVGPLPVVEALEQLYIDSPPFASQEASVKALHNMATTWAASDFGPGDLATPGVLPKLLAVLSAHPVPPSCIIDSSAAVRAAAARGVAADDAELEDEPARPKSRVGSVFSRSGHRNSLTPTVSAELWSVAHVEATPAELAAQLTLLDQERRLKISSRDVLPYVRADPSARAAMNTRSHPCSRVARCAAYSELVFCWVGAEVLQRPLEALGRTQMVSRFLHVADACRALNSFNCMAAIMSVLNSPLLQPLETMWAFLSADDKKLLEDLRAAVAPDDGHSMYREMWNALDRSTPALSIVDVEVAAMTAAQMGEAAVLLDDAAAAFTPDSMLPSACMVELEQGMRRLLAHGRAPVRVEPDRPLQDNLVRCLSRAPRLAKLQRMAEGVAEREATVIQSSLEEAGFG